MPMPPLPDLATMSLSDVALALALAEKRLPPVDQWHPEHCGDSEMRIARDGTWYHQGAPITRPAMVRLFASILRREADGSFVLVTPAEKLDIVVEDAPFLAVEMKSEGVGRDRRVAFRLNTGELVAAGDANGIRFANHHDGPHPYLHVRGGLEALITRAIYYDLVNLALDEDALPPGLWSNGVFFAMAAA
jgi:uncharacterized protein